MIRVFRLTQQIAQLVAQVIMPVAGFAGTVAFFEDELNNLVAAGELKAELVEDARAFYRKRTAGRERCCKRVMDLRNFDR